MESKIANEIEIETDRQKDRQTDRQTDRVRASMQTLCKRETCQTAEEP